jgi:phospholipase/carboxylesterase
MQVIATLGSLVCRILQETSGPADLTVVLCHGFGAPGDDLVPLGPALMEQAPQLAPRTRFVFPEAPLSLSQLGLPYGRAWWKIDFDRLSAARDPQSGARLSQETPEGLPKARRMLLAVIDELTRQMPAGPSALVLGGFSQGAMLATDVALRLAEAPAGLIVLSGTLICEPDWRKRAPARSGLAVFQSHGTQDPLLPYKRAIALRDLFQQSGFAVDFLSFDGGHTIPVEALQRAAGFLVRCLPHR